MRSAPSLRSTVTPAKFATFCRLPVSRLKSAVLPQLGLPRSAMRNEAACALMASMRRVEGHQNTLRFEPPQRERGAADAHGNGLAAREAVGHDAQGLAFDEADLLQPTRELIAFGDAAA